MLSVKWALRKGGRGVRAVEAKRLRSYTRSTMRQEEVQAALKSSENRRQNATHISDAHNRYRQPLFFILKPYIIFQGKENVKLKYSIPDVVIATPLKQKPDACWRCARAQPSAYQSQRFDKCGPACCGRFAKAQ